MPNRILKETICTSENLNSLEPEAEVFLYRLIVTCDDYGIFFANTSILRAKCFPLRIDRIKDRDIEKWLKALIEAKLIFLYEYEDRQYLKLSKWENHQQVRASKSKYPTPNMEGIRMISNDINGNQLHANAPVFVSVSVSDSSNRIRNREKREESADPVPYSELQEIFNRVCVSFAKVQKMSNSRKEKLRTRWSEIKTIEAFEKICTKMELSNFLKGDNPRKWMPTFDWLLENDNNWVKVIEGNYDNKQGGTKKNESNERFTGSIASGEAEADEEWPISNSTTRGL
ncbi:MAG TPA: hypothetical protein VN456_00825 [Desulfosporosinus sp.]|nr:hypothetical protein [Desulfosporosinus sp.]